jgi:cell division septal protein FtsQ
MLKFRNKNKKNQRLDSKRLGAPVMRNQYFGDMRSSSSTNEQAKQRFDAKKSPRVRFKKLNKLKKLSKRGFYLAISVLTLIFIWWLSLISTRSHFYSNIQNLNINQTYRNDLQEFSDSKVSNYTLLNLDSKKVESQITQKFSDVKSVQIKRIWYKKGVDISYVMREPIIKWQAGSELKFIDENGVILNSTPVNQNDLYVIEDNSGLKLDSGEKVFAERNVTFCGLAMKAVNNNPSVKNNFVGFGIPATSLKEIDIKLKSGLVVKLSTELDPEGQVSLLAQIIDKLANEGKTPAEYIDLRVPGKVFWK